VINKIQEIRLTIERGLTSARPCPDGRVTELSPCGNYRLEIEEYANSTGGYFSIAVVRRADSGHEISTIKRNDSRCFYGWVSQAGHDYLLFSEDLEGQTVVDLANGNVVGYSSPDDPFIWTEFHASPDRTKLAIVGCYWACPYQVTVYDFRAPLDLPLPKLAEYVLPENDAEFMDWGTEEEFRVQSRNGCVHLFKVLGEKSRF